MNCVSSNPDVADGFSDGFGNMGQNAAKVKICGIRRQEDILLMNRLIPDFIGFVFAPSKRRVSPELAAQLVQLLDGGIRKVGVFVDEKPEAVVSTARLCRLDAVQLHGDECAGEIRDIRKQLGEGVEVWKAIRVKNPASLNRMEEEDAHRYLLDACSGDAYGGTGKSFDWRLVEGLCCSGRIILAGGLTPDNVHAAIRRVQPYAVDVSSGVETDGFKDSRKVKNFLYSVRYTHY